MVVHDNLLEQLSKALNSESFVVPSHAAFATSDLTLDPAMTSFSGEVPQRTALSTSRVGTTISYNGIKTGTLVALSGGETLYETALFSASTSGTLLAMQGLPSILHTTNFDIEVNWDVTVDRA